MRIDFQQGEHLRVGRLLVTWHPDGAHHRRGLHDTWMGETRADTHKVERVARLAEELVADAAPSAQGTLDLVTSKALNRLGEALTDWHLSVETERFGGVCTPIAGRLLSVGWKDSRPPGVDRLRPTEAKRRLRHKLRRWLGVAEVPVQGRQPTIRMVGRSGGVNPGLTGDGGW